MRDPAEIRADIERARSDLARSLHDLEERLSPRAHLRPALDRYVRPALRNLGEVLAETPASWADALKRSPVPVTLVGIGLAWLMMGGQRPPRRSRPEEAAGAAREAAQAVREKVEAVGERLREGAASAGERASRVPRENPLAISAAGVAAGLAAGLLLPLSPRERRLIARAVEPAAASPPPGESAAGL